jgi:hypothetical protein
MYHPDKLAGLAPEFQALADRRMKEINAAHELLKRNARALTPMPTPSNSAQTSAVLANETDIDTVFAGEAEKRMILDSVKETRNAVPIGRNAWELRIDGISLGIIEGETQFDLTACGIYRLLGASDRSRVEYRDLSGTEWKQSKFTMYGTRSASVLEAAKEAGLAAMLRAKVYNKGGKLTRIEP